MAKDFADKKLETEATPSLAKQVSENIANKGKETIPPEVQACIGKKFVIIEATKIAKQVSDDLFDILYENAVVTHGAKNVRAFVANKDNLKELHTILQKYSNSILK